MTVEDSDKISYRDNEAVGCVGMQSVVESDLGLCDNLKPNRFLGTERKRISRILHVQDPLFFSHLGDNAI